MEQHGKRLARAHKLTAERSPDRLLPRLAANEAVLVEACKLLTAAMGGNRRLAPAGAWLLDNFYLIEEQIGTAKRHLPTGYSRQLPRLAAGPSAGLPRVYDIALETIAHGDGHLRAETLARFVAAYESITPMTLGELWAIPIMLRLALIENIRRVASEIAAATSDRRLAGAWADRMKRVAEADPKGLILLIADMARSHPPMSGAFVSELARRLQGHGPALALPLTWIEQRLSESHQTIDELVQSAAEQQAIDQVSISNSVGSLRFLGATDWRSFVESMSTVERVLQDDPGGIYGKMDFLTRDHYRHVIERLARRSGKPEVEVARAARTLAEQGKAGADAQRRSHVGYYLIDEGRAVLERSVDMSTRPLAALRTLPTRFRAAFYLGAIGAASVLMTVAMMALARQDALSWPVLALIAAASVLMASQLAVSLGNWLLTLLVAPSQLPRMDFEHGLPPGTTAVVAVPAMLVTMARTEALAEALEVRFLANQDANLSFALLTDFVDASEETLPGDAELLEHAQAQIRALNEKHRARRNWPGEAGAGERAGDPFYLFHRGRTWNARERRWMGYERKRGKLGDLNAVLQDQEGAQARFSLIVGDTAVLRHARYVITLDSDTELPRNAARQLVATMAHPLNRPHYDAHAQRVTSGYGILQPRVVASLPGSNRSLFARLFGGEPGIDPYTRAVSDPYQDVFGEGSFVGKGIYDVEAFEAALKDRFPANRILSHDLLEGNYARSGLATDVQLYETYPSRYQDDVSRRRRWIRGDWQVASWLLPWVPDARGKAIRNPLTALSRWKLLDNLRRSLVPAASMLLLLFAWTVMTRAWAWTLAVLAAFLVPWLLASLLELLRVPQDVPLLRHLAMTAGTALRRAVQLGFTLACLPHEASFSLAAILRAHWRTFVTRTLMLEWTASGEIESPGAGALRTLIRSMWVAPTLAAAACAYLAVARPNVLAIASPILLLWFLSPAFAWWLSRPLMRTPANLTAADRVLLRKLARRTWGYFEAFVGAADHWLPPDNVQESPVRVARRTSPTNMGLALLGDLAAYDFGYLTMGRFIERSTAALGTMGQLERYRGHCYNWYDTETLQPLPPRYVSSVDSGNLAGYLATLGAALRALPEHRLLSSAVWRGLEDTARVLRESVAGAAAVALDAMCRDLECAGGNAANPYEHRRSLARIRAAVDAVGLDMADDAGAADSTGVTDEAHHLVRALATQCDSARDELDWLLPWVMVPALEPLAAALPAIAAVPSLRDLADVAQALAPALATLRQDAGSATEHDLLDELARLARLGSARATQRMEVLDHLARECDAFGHMDFRFLHDPSRHLLAVGYNVDDGRRDDSYYDLLASEARLSTFVAIAQGQVSQESWFALGRLLTSDAGRPVLMSWSGSMFEYLMPMLVMPSYANTLLDETCHGAVARQMAYGRELGVPWGVSESGYNMRDANLNYQYRAFGVPALGLKRGLADDVVIAPYASMLALMVAPAAACRNLRDLMSRGLSGRFGLFEAIDYTPTRVPRGQPGIVVRSFMAHHQGMSLLALAHLLLDRPMQRRFELEPRFQATLLLLQERVPKAPSFLPRLAQLTGSEGSPAEREVPVRVVTTPDTPVPEVQLLSNGRYHVMVTGSGSGSSRWKDFELTRWREDATRDPWGSFCYLRDVASGAVWSTTHQPTTALADAYEANFTEGRAEFRRRDHGIDAHTQIIVSPEDDVELRRTRLMNRSRTVRVVELTTYTEIVLAPGSADADHPAFSNLFVQTEIAASEQAILCTRRPRSPGERTPCLLHLVAVHDVASEQVSYETDRMRFIGRGNTTATPRAMEEAGALSGTSGAVLDPIAAIRLRVSLEPGEAATFDVVYGAAESRDAAMGLVSRYRDRRLADRAIELAWTHAQVVLRQINATDADARLYARLANSIVFANASLRADAAVIARNRRPQSGLWGYAISGDLPIVLLRIASAANIDLVRQLVQAHAYWRLKGLVVDLVIWNEDHGGYRQLLQDQIVALITARVEAQMLDHPGGIFVRRGDQIAEEDRVLLESAARVIISDRDDSLEEQLGRAGVARSRPPPLAPTVEPAGEPGGDAEAHPHPDAGRDTILDNGLGGFSADGTEYVIRSDATHRTPAPWVNVLANARFGTVVSESGAAYTWSENAHEFRLTPWSNDPVTDATGEACYLRDEETGVYWSPTPQPARGRTPHVTRHGFGYTVFAHRENGIASEQCVYVAKDEPVKFSTLTLRNDSGRRRRLSVTGYVEWVLGALRHKSAMHVTTERDARTGALYARNAYSTEFGGRVAFFDTDDLERTLTCDRTEFIGRNGSLLAPAAMRRTRLSGRTGPGLDPCAAIQVTMALDPGEERTITFRLGAGASLDEARSLASRMRGALVAATELERVRAHWREVLGAVQVDTPDVALNVLCNGWLVYQTIACRLWARSGFYQSGGAFGFRDQLQDVLAVLHARPDLARAQLLLCASRQFIEGDVQHWWHPPSGRGVRTRCSDDFLWLPLAMARYVSSTGDAAVLEEPVPFLDARPVNAGEDSYYDLPGRSAETADLYEHGRRAIVHALHFGAHGLPLMGSGDWNDGMNLVGIEGRGESVWLGFFLCHVLGEFAGLARSRGDAAFAARCDATAATLSNDIERQAWDGDWYRRAYFDDGSPLGSAGNAECQIDSIAQSWSVLSGAGEPTRARTAMEAVHRRLVRPRDGVVLLLEPPFDRELPHPGYIRGYVPGVRENGGQYTHAAVWSAMAFAELGDAARAWELFDLINPVNHGRTAEAIATYRIEPYVVAADVYAVPPHTARGGWSWYTGSAGWMYRLILESLLGLRRTGDMLRFAPCLPPAWKSFALRYRRGQANYAITVVQADRDNPLAGVWLDGELQSEDAIPLVDDNRQHVVRVVTCEGRGAAASQQAGIAAMLQGEPQ
jgi:cellobiose phosphorylase